MFLFERIYVFILCLAACARSENLPSSSICDIPRFRECYLQTFNLTLTAAQGDNGDIVCRSDSFKAYVNCTNEQLDACDVKLGSEASRILRPYVLVLENIFSKTCAQVHEDTGCDFSVASKCFLHFGEILSQGQLGPICRQAEVTLQCLEEPLDSCSGIQRYLFALVTDEIKLTSDLLCHHGSCSLEVAGQCLHDAMETLDFPVAIVQQSPIVCNKIRSALACVTNRTMDCKPASVPESVVRHYTQLYQFSVDFCGVVADNFMLMNIPAELVGPAYLALLSKNKWTTIEQICWLYNSTVISAAHYGNVMPTYTDSLLTWQHSMEITLDKYHDVCFSHQTADCTWLDRAANSFPVCNVMEAEKCLDVVLISKMVVEASLQKDRWENICGYFYNMMACVGHFIDGCQEFDDVIPVNQSLEAVVQLVGARCGQLGTTGQPGSCNNSIPTCDIMKALEECGTDTGSVCLSSEDIFNCFRRDTEGCNSVAMVLAQFYMEWLLRDCPLNKTIISYDILHGVSSCSLQLGYNLYNGLQMSSDFTSVLCAAGELHQLCLTSETIPQMALLYMEQNADMLTVFQQNQCSGTLEDSFLLNFEENQCDWSYISSEITKHLMMISSFSLLSVQQQQQVCQSVSALENQLPSYIAECSPDRQTVAQQAAVFLYEAYKLQCQTHHFGPQKSCDTKMIQTCLDNFGASLNFASASGTICSELDKVYHCIYDNSQSCDSSVENSLLSEVKIIQSMMGNVSCPVMSWCNNPVNQSVVVQEMCTGTVTCSLDWSSCVAFTGYAYCFNVTDTKNCIMSKLSQCDPLHFVMVKSFMFQSIQNSGAPECNFLPEDPATVLPVHYSIAQCQQFSSMTTDVTRTGLCNSIGQYLQCMSAVDQADLPLIWRGILGRNVLIWQKWWYLGCQLSDGEKFIVDHSFNDTELFGDNCQSFQGQMCLRSLADLAVSYVMLPLPERQYNLCQMSNELLECVHSQVAGCTNSLERAMLTSAQWFSEKIKSTGVCDVDKYIKRSCDPSAALSYISELGTTPTGEADMDKVACSQLLTTAVSVDEKTSSCDHNTRSEVLTTFFMVSGIVRQSCTQESAATSQGCIATGERTFCDLEEVLTCMVPVRAKMLQPHLSSLQEICGMIPAMKSCIQRQSSGCDDITMTTVNNQLLQLNLRLGNQCPQMYCEECKARQCVADLYESLQYTYDDLCVLVAETKQCIYDNAQYCDRRVGELLHQEMVLLVGEEGQRCEVSLPACLRTLMLSAFQIMNYQTEYVATTTNTSSNDLAFMSVCNEAAAAYYCVSYHVSSMQGARQWVMNETLEEIGALVSLTCQGPRLQCYSCMNTTSNEECNSQPVQSCASDMQSCGTMVSGGYLSKGCVRPETCQNGCYGDTCSMCCQDDMCNQPWNDVIVEPLSCQPKSALWCGFQLLNTLAQNDTVDCSVLQEAITCMTSSTATCALHLSVSLGLHAHQLLNSDVALDCISKSSVCSCGQCTSLILLSLVSNQYTQSEEFCSIAADLYNKTQLELSSQACSISTLQSTIYNLNMAVHMAYSVCDIAKAERECFYNGEVLASGTSFNATDNCNTCQCNNGLISCTLMYCPPDLSGECPPIADNSVGTCVEECSTDKDCFMGLICCSNGCGHTCQRKYVPGDADCRYGNTTYQSGASFPDLDGCNTCFCSNGLIGCTLMYCPPQDSHCVYNNKKYNTGETFNSTDGCNTCFCYHGSVGCTERACDPIGYEACNYGNMTYSHGENFLSADGCNHCFCTNGKAACTKMYCYGGNENCFYGTTVYHSGDIFHSEDGCNLCVCGNGHVGCTDIACPNTGYQPCNYGNMTYSHGDNFLAADGCNHCLCTNGKASCTQMYCYGGRDMCFYGYRLYQSGDIFPSEDGCNLCVCGNGHVGCTEIACPSVDAQCFYGNRIYNSGDSFPARDGCNTCFCSNGGVGCTWKLCPPSDNRTEYHDCDIQGIHGCFEDAALPQLSAMWRQGGSNGHICMSARNMLRCVHTKINTCPSNVLALVRNAVWWNLGHVEKFCDVWEIVNSYNNETRPNNTTPGNTTTHGECSMNQALACFHEVSADKPGVCSVIHAMIDCVEDLISGCVSVTRVPVLYELQRHLLPIIDTCNVTVSPPENYDPLYPVSKCTEEFATDIDMALSKIYFRIGSKTTLCDHLDDYLKCLYTAQLHVPPVGNLFISNIVNSLSVMIYECEQHRQETDLQTCHTCDWSNSEGHCDKQPAQKCLPNQLCHTTMQHDINTGVAMVTKGCADVAWCQTWYGCNPYTMTCVNCCYGNNCNSADNTTFTTQPNQQTTTSKPPPTTTTLVDQCDVSTVSSNMVVLMLQLMNFNFLPMIEKQFFCMNFHDNMAQTVATLDPRCNNATMDRVNAMAEWLTNLRDNACPDIDAEREAWQKCMGAVRCVQGLGNFTERSGSCRSIKESSGCLRAFYQQCPADALGALNRTVELLSYMDDLVCVNETLPGPEPQCVNVTSNKPSAVCNSSAAMNCGVAIHRSLYSPFTNRDQFCSTMKRGMQCIQDNTFNCSTGIHQQVWPVVMEILHHSSDLCPNLWCPVNDHCRLEVANRCLDKMEQRIQGYNTTGQIDKDICFNLSTTHHCVWNATEKCHMSDSRQILQRYSQLLLFLYPHCHEQTIPTNVCLEQFQSTTQYLNEFDQLFTLKLSASVADYIHIYTSVDRGLGLPGARGGERGQDASTNLTGIGLPDVQSLLARIGLPTVQGALYGLGSVNLQTMVTGLGLPPIFTTNLAGINMTEFISLLLNQNFFEGNLQEILVEYGFQSNSMSNNNSGSSMSKDPSSRIAAGSFNGYSGRKKRSLNPNDPDRAGNKTTFWNDGNSTSAKNSSTNSNGNITNNANNQGNRTSNNKPGILNGTNANFTKYSGRMNNNGPYLFNGTHYLNASVILSMVNLTVPDLKMFLDQSVYTVYSNHKMAACSQMQQAFSCLQDNLGPHIQLLEPMRGFILEKTLEGLMKNSVEYCQDLQCHSCIGLGDNEECNQQPVVTCSPLQVCQSRIIDGQFTKGCAPVWSCDQECRQSDGPCYCCHGKHCNEPELAVNRTCNIPAALNCTSSLLQHMMNHTKLDMSIISEKATCLMAATTGCHTRTQKDLHTLGNKILRTVNCSKEHGWGMCNTTATLSFEESMLNTYATSDVICRSFNTSLSSFLLQEGSCYRNLSSNHSSTLREMLILRFNRISTICPNTKAHLLYENGKSCSINTTTGKAGGDVTRPDASSGNPGNRNRVPAGNGTESNGRQGRSNVSVPMNGTIGNETIGGLTCSGNNSSRNGTNTPVCFVPMAVKQCIDLHLHQTASNCSVSEVDSIITCIHNFTSDCVSVQLLPVTARLVLYKNACLKRNINVSVSSDMLQKDHLSPVANCLNKFISGTTAQHNQSTIHNMCLVADDVIDCLATEEHNENFLYSKYISSIIDKVKMLKEHVCNTDTTAELCSNYSTIELGMHVIDTLTLHLMSLDELVTVCRSTHWMLDSSAKVTGDNTTLQCEGAPSSLKTWIEDETRQLCSSRVVKDMCIQPTCDVAMAKEMMTKMSYYFTSAYFSDNVFCGNLQHLLKSLRCYLYQCNETDVLSIRKELLYVRHIVHDRCPAYTEMLYCDAELQELVEDKPDTNRPLTQVPTRQTTPESSRVTPGPSPSRRPPVTTPGGSPSATRDDGLPSGSGAPGNTSSCSPTQAQWCLFSVTLPSIGDENYCRLLLESVDKLAHCVKDRVAGCSSKNISTVHSYYSNMFREAEGQCGMNLTSRLFNQSHTKQCEVPSCLFTGALNCLDILEGNATSCGNILEVTQCIQWTTEGCSNLQKYPVITILRNLVMHLGIEETCWKNKTNILETTFSNGIIGCVSSFTDLFDKILLSDKGVPVCELVQLYTGCVNSTSEDVPLVMKQSINHLAAVMKEPLATVCKHEDDQLLVSQEASEGCDLDRARMCLNSYTVNTLMAPTLTQEGKNWVCQNLDNDAGCLDKALTTCSSSTTKSVKTLYHLIRMMGQLSGVCSPHPHVCSPDIAVECMSHLEELVIQGSHYGNSHRVCRALDSTESCMKQTMLRCDQRTQERLYKMFEPIRCKAYTLCPMAVEENTVTMQMPPSCINPGMVMYSGKCNPGQALYCIQDFYGDFSDPLVKRDEVCMSYARSLQCFFDSLHECDRDFPILLAHQYLLKMTEAVGDSCNVTITSSCDLDQWSSQCDLNHVDTCMSEVERLQQTNYTDEEMCYALQTLESCVSYHTSDCPRVTFLYARSLLMKFISRKHLSDIECNTASSCGWSYVQLLKSSMIHQMQLLGEDTIHITKAEEHEVEVSSVCEKHHSSLECLKNYTKGLPDDVAIVTNSTLHHLENLFSYTCGDMFSLQSCISCNSPGCLSCYSQSLEYYLPPLLSFLNRGKDDQDLTFCRMPLNDTDWYSTITQTEACQDGQDATKWNMFYAQSVEDLYMKYCLMPCNQSRANECIQKFQNQSASASDEEVCRLFDEVDECLNMNVINCAVNVMRSYFSLAESIFNGTNVICYVMPTLTVESTDMIYLEEGGSVQYINVTLESFIIDSCHGNYCEMEIFISNNNSVLPSCLNGLSVPQFVSSSCSFILSQETGQISIPFVATADHKVELHHNTEVKILARLWEDGVPVAMDTVSVIPVSVIDVDTARVCSGKGPYMTTFDGFFFGNFYKGEFIIYQHTEFQYKVHAAIQKCGKNGKCICAVMVQADDDVYILDRCKRKGEKTHPLEFYAYVNSAVTQGIHVFRSDDGNTFQFVLPTGTIITAQSLTLELMISVQPSPSDRNNTRGLCGVFDYNVTNDLTLPDGSEQSTTNENYLVLRNTTFSVYRPKSFLKSWRTGDSLFNGVVASDSQTSSATTTWCDCTNSSSHCIPYELVQTCDFVEGLLNWNSTFRDARKGLVIPRQNKNCTMMKYRETFYDCHMALNINCSQPLFRHITRSPGEDIIGNMELYRRYSDNVNRRRRHVTLTDLHSRNKRQATSSSIDWGDDEDDEDLSFLTFPTSSGITENTANTACKSALVDSELGKLCEPLVDTSQVVVGCVTDVLMWDSIQSALESSLSSLKQQCRTAVVADPTTVVDLNTTIDQVVPYLLNMTCLNDCSGRGNCVQAVCQCNAGYTGADCSLDINQAPVVVSLSQDLYTANIPATAIVSTETVVLGDLFVNTGSLYCHMEMIELTDSGYNRTGNIQSSPATFLTSQSVSCPVTGSLPLSVLLLSVSNNGVNRSAEFMYIIQDSICYDCDPVARQCSLQPTSCVLEGNCYAAGDYNPTDQCLICDPISNQWKYKSSQTCPATTTSTSTTPSTVSDTTSSTSVSTISSATNSTSSQTTPSGSTSTTSSSVSPTSSSTNGSSVSTSASTVLTTQSPATGSTSSSTSASTVTTTQSPESSSISSESTTSSSVTSTSSTGSTSLSTSAQPVSSTPTSASTVTSLSSSSIRSTSLTPLPSSSTTEPAQGGDTDQQSQDQRTLTIVIAVAVVMAVIVIIGIVIVSFRLRRQDMCTPGHKADTSGVSPSESDIGPGGPELQGRRNPAYEDIVYDNNGQPVTGRRNAPARTAPFNPRGLVGDEDLVGHRRTGPPDEEDGLHRVNVHMFEKTPASRDDANIHYAKVERHSPSRHSPQRSRPLGQPKPDYGAYITRM